MEMLNTEQLINEDGHIDEGAAGALIDETMKKMNNELQEIAAVENDTLPPDGLGDDSTVDDDDSDSDDWTTADDVQDLLDSIGYSQEDIADFESRDELDRHIRLLDRKAKLRPGDEQERALEADELARQKMERSDQAEDRYRENGKFAKKPSDTPELEDADEFDDRLVDYFRAQQEQIAHLQQQLEGATQQALLVGFHEMVDGMGDYKELFGNSEDLSADNESRRERLWDAYVQVYNNTESQGKPVFGQRTKRAMITRAMKLEFEKELKKHERQKLKKKVKDRQSRFTGSGSRNQSDHYDGPQDKDPVLLQKYQDLLAENG